MSSDTIDDRATDDRTVRFAGGLLVLVGLHFVVEAALGMVHAIPGSGPLTRGYALVAAALFLAVGGTLLKKGRLANRRLELVAAVLAGLVLVLVSAGHLV